MQQIPYPNTYTIPVLTSISTSNASLNPTAMLIKPEVKDLNATILAMKAEEEDADMLK